MNVLSVLKSGATSCTSAMQGVKKGKRKRTSAGRYITPRTQNLYDALTAEYGSAPVSTLAPPATRGFYGNYSKRGRDELKVIENAPSGNTSVTSSGALSLINGVAQGTDFTNRVGRKINIKSLLLRFSLAPSGTVETGDVARVMAVYDTQANSGSLPAVTDVLTTADCYSGINLNNRDRFKVLFDKKYPMHPVYYNTGTLTAGAPVVRYVEKYKKLNLDTIFSGTAGTIGSISTGSIFWLYISFNSGTEINFYSRVRFTDP